ncbi:MAG TPA: SDR family oxidoreductase [Bacillales bacterium]|nr:SDR family oxidoreductase [Bacillales bacterium]
MDEQAYPSQQPPQHQAQQPGHEGEMTPKPIAEDPKYRASGKLTGKKALITGGDSGIGRAVAIAFAKEGADVAVVYLNENEDAAETQRQVEQLGRRCLTFPGDLADEPFCNEVVTRSAAQLGGIDILVNNAAEQHPQTSFEMISAGQLEKTFRTNVFSYFYMTKAALSYLSPGSAIINTASITAYKGNATLIDYSATKGAVVSFTSSLSQSLVDRGIRVNGVAPGPIWTPLIPSTFPPEQVQAFGSDTPMKRAGQPEELAASYVFLACDDSSYMTGQLLHVNGGTIVNG